MFADFSLDQPLCLKHLYPVKQPRCGICHKKGKFNGYCAIHLKDKSHLLREIKNKKKPSGGFLFSAFKKECNILKMSQETICIAWKNKSIEEKQIYNYNLNISLSSEEEGIPETFKSPSKSTPQRVGHEVGTPFRSARETGTPRKKMNSKDRSRIWNYYIGLRLGAILCPYCGKNEIAFSKINDKIWEAAHVIPHSKGGTSDIDNLRPICRKCNQDMKDDQLDVDKWDRGFISSMREINRI